MRHDKMIAVILMSHDEMIAVIQAEKDGKRLRVKSNLGGVWVAKEHEGFNFAELDYEIAPEPFECWVNRYPDGVSSSWESKESADLRAVKSRIGPAIHMVQKEGNN